MRKLFISIVFLLVVAGVAFAETPVEVMVTNNTEYRVLELYASPSSSDDWGDDLLGGEPLEWGDMKNLTLSLTDGSDYDFQMIDLDGDLYNKFNVNISEDSEVEFVFDDIASDDFGCCGDSYDYESSYNEGYSQGYTEGFTEAYRTAYAAAFQAGFQAGLENEQHGE